jgi:hypothetical protein
MVSQTSRSHNKQKPPREWLSQSLRILNANAANLRMTRINSEKIAKFAHSRYSRSKSANLSSDFATATLAAIWETCQFAFRIRTFAQAGEKA